MVLTDRTHVRLVFETPLQPRIRLVALPSVWRILVPLPTLPAKLLGLPNLQSATAPPYQMGRTRFLQREYRVATDRRATAIGGARSAPAHTAPGSWPTCARTDGRRRPAAPATWSRRRTLPTWSRRAPACGWSYRPPACRKCSRASPVKVSYRTRPCTAWSMRRAAIAPASNCWPERAPAPILAAHSQSSTNGRPVSWSRKNGQDVKVYTRP